MLPSNDENIEQNTEDIKQEDVIIVGKKYKDSMSSAIGKLAFALSKAQGACSNGIKSKEGYGYKYMELGQLIEIIRVPLAENELAIIQTNELINASLPSITVHTHLLHSSGEWFKTSLEIKVKIMKQLTAAQMAGVASTYGRRYALQSLMLIASEEDTDGTVTAKGTS